MENYKTILETEYYYIDILHGTNGLNTIDDNVDVEVRFKNGERYVGTIFTIKNMLRLMESGKKTGECMNGLYYYATDMVLVNELTINNIALIIKDLIDTKSIQHAFSLCDLNDDK